MGVTVQRPRLGSRQRGRHPLEFVVQPGCRAAHERTVPVEQRPEFADGPEFGQFTGVVRERVVHPGERTRDLVR